MAVNKNTKKSLTRLIISGLLIGIAIVITFFVLKHFGITELSQDELQEAIASTGAIAPLAFIFASFLQVTIIPIPSAVTVLAGSYLFGAFTSFFYSFIGIIAGALFAYWLGRLIGRPYINWIAGSREEADHWLAKLNGRENVFLFFAFLFPLFPDDLLCSVAGMLPVKFHTFVIMQVVTRITGISATLIFMSGAVIPYEGWGLWVIGVLCILAITLFVISMKYAVELNALFDSLVKKVANKLRRKK